MTIYDSNFYTYVYYDTRPEKNLEAIYVGKGKNQRSHSHLKNCGNHLLSKKLEKMKAKNLQPRIVILEACSEEHAFEMEISLIQKYGRINLKTGTLCNLTDGGEGLSGLKFSDTHKAKLSIAGRNMSNETKDKISTSKLGHSTSLETRKKLSDSGKYRSDDAKHKTAEGRKIHAEQQRRLAHPEWSEEQHLVHNLKLEKRRQKSGIPTR